MEFLRKLRESFYQIPGAKLVGEIVFLVAVAVAIRTIIFGFYIVPTGSMETTLLVGERFFADKLTYYFRKPQRSEIIAFDDPTFQYSDNKLVNFWQRYFSPSVSNWTKRVIGIPGDSIKGAIEEGKTVIYLKKAGQENYEKLDESAYINKYPLIYLWKYPHYQNPGNYKEYKNMEPRSFDPNVNWLDQKIYKINPNRIVLNANQEPTIFWPGTPMPGDVFEITLKDNEYWVMGDNRLGSADCREWGIPPYGKPLNANLIHGRILFRIWSMDTDESWILLDLLKHPIEFFKKVRWNRNFQWVS